MRKVFLVGTDHRYQRGFALGVEDGAFEEFRAMLRGVIAQQGIRGIAEEMNHEGLSVFCKTGSVGFCLAHEFKPKLAHRYCDPDQATRKALSIEKREEGDTKREQYWLEQLQTFDGFPALFILGANHFESFKSLLTRSGFQVFDVQRDWEPSSDWGQDNWKRR